MVESASSTLDSVFHALSDATRRAILRDCGVEGKAVGELAKPYRMSLAAVSKHVHVLERAALVERERRGQFQIVRLNPKSLRAAQDWLAFYETFWTQQLDALQTHLERAEGPARKGHSDAST
jgi:DNA-binding transcriptional ArsR family regulator